MAQELTIKAVGLVTDPNPRAVADAGMSTALNVTIDREGILNPRPGFSWTSSVPEPTKNSLAAAPYSGDVVLFNASNGTDVERGGYTLSGTLTLPSSGYRNQVTMQARNNLYVTNDPSPVKIGTLKTGLTWIRSGMPQGMPPLCQLVGAAGATPLAASNGVAYSTCFVRTDANGDIIRSAPSGVARVRNDTGAASNVQVTIPLKAIALYNWLQPGDVIELYRSAQGPYATVEPPDDMNLVHEFTLTSSDISTGSVTFNDQVTDAYMQAQPALYTGPSQEGALASNDPPPWCVDMAYMNTCSYYAQAQQTGRFVLALGGVNGNAWTGAALGKRACTITSAGIGASTVTVAVAQPYVGQCLNDAATPTGTGTLLQADTIVTVVTGAGPWTATLSKVTLAAGGPTAGSLWDVVNVGGVDFYASDSTAVASREFKTTGVIGDLDIPLGNFCYVVNQNQTCTVFAQPLPFGLTLADTVTGAVSVEFVGKTLTAADATLFESGGDGSVANAWYGPQDFYGTLPPSRIVPTNQPGTMWMSKPSLPEAVPIAQQIVVGDAYKKILRIVPVRTALWIFKEDGLFRLTGNSYDTVNVDLIDPSVQLLHGEAADAMDDTVYAWTTRGVVRIGDGGMENISQPRIGTTLRSIEQALAPRASGNFGIFLRCDPSANRVYLAVPSAAGVAFASSLYVYSVRTGSWTSWAPFWGTPTSVGAFGTGMYTLAYDPGIGGMVMHAFNTGNSRRVFMQQRLQTDTYRFSDQTETLTVSTCVAVGDGTYTVTLSGAPSVLMGNTLYVGDYLGGYTVTSVTSATVYIVDGNVGTGSKNAARCFMSSMTWQPFQGAGRWFNEKVYRDCQVSLDAIANMTGFTATLSGGTVAPTFTRGTTSIIKRFGIPRHSARIQLFSLGLSVRQALAAWQLDGVTLSYDIGGKTTGR